MNPQIQKVQNNGDIFTFTLSGVNVSIANALRRTIISDIPTVVFETEPYEKNKANILVNTSRLNNEILKQRLSCIPIHIQDLDINLDNYLLEVDVENLTDTIMYATTEDFKIKNIETGKYLNDKETRDIFPPNDQTGYYIDFVRLRPRISDEIHGEKIHLTCSFSIKTVKDNSMYNSVSTCSYGYTPDYVKIEDVLNQKKQEWKDNGLKESEIDFEVKNWKLLDALRITKEDSFDFIIQSIGVFLSVDIVRKACVILINKLNSLKDVIETDTIVIVESKTTMMNCYDVVLKNEDYTLGKVIEFVLYNNYFDLGQEDAILTYCGFKKMHPHDTDSLIRLAFKSNTEIEMIKSYLLICIQDALTVFTNIKNEL